MDIQGTEASQQPHLPVYITNLPLPKYLDITVSDAYNIVKNPKHIVGLLQQSNFYHLAVPSRTKYIVCMYMS